MTITKDVKKEKANRLVKEKSPYLQQHAYNPVDWYPWGKEALAAAKKQNKPIFLSIGYSTCHWCHVMEHESFENKEIAAIMNKHFINIKVDREERPDLDAIYMEAVQMLTGSGGWPMSVWLTPDLKPFYGGTYYPPEDRYGRPGFPTLLTQIALSWEKNKERILESSSQIGDVLKKSAEASYKTEKGLPPVNEVLDNLFNSLEQTYDPKEGGFGPAPKFPMPVYMDFLLTYFSRTKNPKALEMVRFTMTKMLNGGIYDQLGGGFARYSTDARWIVPHFEKMLYDNGQLITVLVHLSQITGDPVFKQAAKDSISYVLRDMTHPEGAFYSAEDADSEGKEGTFYLWTLAEIKKLLGDEIADPFIHYYGVTANGNFHDPHTGEIGKNILVRENSIEETAKKFNKSNDEITNFIKIAEKRLFDVRVKRPRPHLDDKILTGWNGLMITALAKAGSVFKEPAYAQAAVKSADFILSNLIGKNGDVLYRRWREGEKKIEAHQIDYALFVQGLLDLFEATGDPRWLESAAKLNQKHNELFYDSKEGGYFMTVPNENLLVRMKDDRDNVIPSGNSIAVINGFRLGDLANNKDWVEKAQNTLVSFSKIVDLHPAALAKMIMGYDFEANGHLQVVLVGSQESAENQKLFDQINQTFLPNKLVIMMDPAKTQDRISQFNPILKNMKEIDGKPTAYVCVDYSCQRPTNEVDVLREQLAKVQTQNN